MYLRIYYYKDIFMNKIFVISVIHKNYKRINNEIWSYTVHIFTTSGKLYFFIVE